MPQPEAMERLLKPLGLRVQAMEPMHRHTTWGIGGPADCFVQPRTFTELGEAVRLAQAAGVPWIVIGQGSNLLFADEGFRGIVIRIGRELAGIHVDGCRICAEAGALACRVAVAAYRHRMLGLEHVVGIPGTMGGLVVMNGGSLRKSIGDSIAWVEGCDEAGQPFRLTRADCRFGYRDSLFAREPGRVVFRCALDVLPGDAASIRRTLLAQLRERRGKFPLKTPNCGSVFRSSPELYALAGPPGRIIEACKFKGRQVGGAQVSPQHANFIVNRGGATAADVLELMRQIRAAVHERWAVWLEAEVKYVRPGGGVVAAHEAACG